MKSRSHPCWWYGLLLTSCTAFVGSPFVGRTAETTPSPHAYALPIAMPAVIGSTKRQEASQRDPQSLNALEQALEQLQLHLEGKNALGKEDLAAIARTIEESGGRVAENAEVLRQAFGVVETYEGTHGPLFMNEATRNGFRRKAGKGVEIDLALFALQQAIIDNAYTPDSLEKHQSLLEGKAFRTSEYFHGPVKSKPDPNKVYRVKINASQPAPWGSPVMFDEDPARRPTGCYLAPGSIATVKVPLGIAGRGFAIRVGAHSWDLSEKPFNKRLDRVSLVFPIKSPTTQVANPLGGGIYVEVPPNAKGGIVEVEIKNVVRSPFFSARSFDKTSLAKWKSVERLNPGPWADFESDRFMMQVPSSWIYRFDDPVRLMKDWDKALDTVSQLFGYPKIRPKSVLYLQVDVVLRGDAYYPGYPQSNFNYNPHQPENGLSDHWLLKGPQTSGATIFHELGHAQLFTKFKGEVEAVVNLPYVAVLNKAFGVDLDQAFGRSFDNPAISLDQAAIMWMVTPNFRNGKPMDISNSEKNEVRYQHRGYGKYVEIVNLFGWKTLERFWRTYQLDYLRGIKLEDRNADPTDARILRLSRQAGYDLTPLIHFWGVQPDRPGELRAAMAKSGLRPSAKIYDRLVHYMALIPMSREDFMRHALVLYPKGLRPNQNANYGEGWYYYWSQRYDRSHGEAAKAALQRIIDTYFPKGRPESAKP